MPHPLQKISPVLLRSEFADNPENPCRVIVEMASPHTDRIAVYIEENAGKVHREMKYLPCMVVEVPYAALEMMVLSPHVKKIWHDIRVKALLDIAVPTAGGIKAHDLGFTGKDVTVAVIDTGISPHPDLIYPRSRIVAWHDLVNGRSTPYDDNGHGTHVSGILAGNGSISRGKYMGMAPEANLVGIKVLDAEGSGNTSDVILGLEWCIENQKEYNIRAINMSLGSPAQENAREDPLCRAIAAAYAKNIVVCVAAGNDGPDARTINTPGISQYAITVGNLDDKGTVEVDDDVISDSSSRGPTIDNMAKPDILAPGTNITSLRVGGGYRSLSGTSMATPMVTGAVAQIYQKWPDLKPEEVKRVLIQNARAMGLQSNYGGSGALNMTDAFEESQKSDPGRSKSLFAALFGEDSMLGKLFAKKAVPESRLANRTNQPATRLMKAKTAESTAGETRPRETNSWSLALLMLLPLAFI